MVVANLFLRQMKPFLPQFGIETATKSSAVAGLNFPMCRSHLVNPGANTPPADRTVAPSSEQIRRMKSNFSTIPRSLSSRNDAETL